MKLSQLLIAPLAMTALAAGCSGSGTAGSTPSPSTTSASSAPASSPGPTAPPTTQPSAPVATESNPPGDIPDNQAFVAYSPPGGGYSVKVPEGWARSTAAGVTSFTDKLNRIAMAKAAGTAPTPDSVRSQLLPALQRQVPKFAMGKVSQISRPAGPVVLVTYQGDSSPDPVTGKVIRDAFEAYLFQRSGQVVTLTLSGPTNADNVDPWKIVSDSFRWQ